MRWSSVRSHSALNTDAAFSIFSSLILTLVSSSSLLILVSPSSSLAQSRRASSTAARRRAWSSSDMTGFVSCWSGWLGIVGGFVFVLVFAAAFRKTGSCGFTACPSRWLGTVGGFPIVFVFEFAGAAAIIASNLHLSSLLSAFSPANSSIHLLSTACSSFPGLIFNTSIST